MKVFVFVSPLSLSLLLLLFSESCNLGTSNTYRHFCFMFLLFLYLGRIQTGDKTFKFAECSEEGVPPSISFCCKNVSKSCSPFFPKDRPPSSTEVPPFDEILDFEGGAEVKISRSHIDRRSEIWSLLLASIGGSVIGVGLWLFQVVVDPPKCFGEED